MDIKTKDFELYERNKDTLALIVYSPRFANRVNSLFSYYDCKIKTGEEPLFLISRNEIAQIYDLLPKSAQNTYIKEKLQ